MPINASYFVRCVLHKTQKKHGIHAMLLPQNNGSCPNAPARRLPGLSGRRSAHLERFAVSALLLSRVHLMGADLNALERAIICVRTMVLALLYRTADALVCMTFVHHNNVLLLIGSPIACPSAHSLFTLLCILER